jgi:hypothetical protein
MTDPKKHSRNPYLPEQQKFFKSFSAFPSGKTASNGACRNRHGIFRKEPQAAVEKPVFHLRHKPVPQSPSAALMAVMAKCAAVRRIIAQFPSFAIIPLHFKLIQRHITKKQLPQPFGKGVVNKFMVNLTVAEAEIGVVPRC